MSGDLAEAKRLYTESIRAYPTAEAHTFLGWAYSMEENYAAAILECRKATIADPEFGNPYNDIGSYLIAQRKWDEAEAWLQRAIRAKRYNSRHYPYMNLGRLHERNMDWDSAKGAYRMAMLLAPTYAPAELALRSLLSRFN
jgi:Tfp pilus assembly protein PilF